MFTGLTRKLGEVDPGTPFHRLARTDRHRWWRPILGTLVFVVAALVSMGVVGFGVGVVYGITAVLGGADAETVASSFPEDSLWTFAIVMGSIVAALPPVLLVARVVQRRPAGTVSSVVGRVRWRWLLECLAVAVPVAAALLVLTGLPDLDALSWSGWGRFAGAAALVIVLVPFQAAAEEYVCRGWIMQAVGAHFRRSWLPILVSAVIFSLLHGFGTVSGFAAAVWFGLVAGWLVIRTGGLEAAIAYHVANNVVIFLAVAAFDHSSLTSETSIADATPYLLGVELVVGTAYAWLVMRRFRRRGLAAVTAEDAGRRALDAPCNFEPLLRSA